MTFLSFLFFSSSGKGKEVTKCSHLCEDCSRCTSIAFPQTFQKNAKLSAHSSALSFNSSYFVREKVELISYRIITKKWHCVIMQHCFCQRLVHMGPHKVRVLRPENTLWFVPFGCESGICRKSRYWLWQVLLVIFDQQVGWQEVFFSTSQYTVNFLDRIAESEVLILCWFIEISQLHYIYI